MASDLENKAALKKATFLAATVNMAPMGTNGHALKKGKIDRSERRLPGNFCLHCLRASRSKRQVFPFLSACLFEP
jgi:hypothetical protein